MLFAPPEPLRRRKPVFEEEIPMIEYEGRVFRPPSEAYSLIVQVSIG